MDTRSKNKIISKSFTTVLQSPHQYEDDGILNQFTQLSTLYARESILETEPAKYGL